MSMLHYIINIKDDHISCHCILKDDPMLIAKDVQWGLQQPQAQGPHLIVNMN